MQEPLEQTPKTLEYLDSSGPRDRLYSLIWTLQDSDPGQDKCEGAPPSDCPPKVKLIQHIAETYRLDRLKRIVEDALAV